MGNPNQSTLRTEPSFDFLSEKEKRSFTKRTAAVRPGFKTVSQQRAAHVHRRFYLIHAECFFCFFFFLIRRIRANESKALSTG